jgi:hypothetical protein
MSKEVEKEGKGKCKFDRDSLEQVNDLAINIYRYDTFIPYNIRDCFGFKDSIIDEQLNTIFENAEDQLYGIFGDDIVLAVFIDIEEGIADFVVSDFSDTDRKWNIEVWRLYFECPISDEEEAEED